MARDQPPVLLAESRHHLTGVAAAGAAVLAEVEDGSELLFASCVFFASASDVELALSDTVFAALTAMKGRHPSRLASSVAREIPTISFLKIVISYPIYSHYNRFTSIRVGQS